MVESFPPVLNAGTLATKIADDSDSEYEPNICNSASLNAGLKLLVLKLGYTLELYRVQCLDQYLGHTPRDSNSDGKEYSLTLDF